MNFQDIKNELYHQNIENVNEKQSFLLVNIIFLIGHVIYLAIFFSIKLYPMFFYNCFSIIFYGVMIFLSAKAKQAGILMVVNLLEVAVHSILGTYFMGWDAGFAQYLIFILPIPFMPEMSKKWIPYFASITDFMVYFVLYFLTDNKSTEPPLENPEAAIIFFINSLFGLCTILYVSSIFFFQRKRIQRQLQEHNNMLQKLATIDPLTKLYNRRVMNEYLKKLDKTSAETGRKYFVALADIDDFKKVNDTYGHDSGDLVLTEIADIMMKNVPKEGCICRWGGEEILYVIPECSMEKGIVSAENIRKAVERFDFVSDTNKHFFVTVTIGVYEAFAGENPENAVRKADSRLYTGKNNGKNQVVSHGF